MCSCNFVGLHSIFRALYLSSLNDNKVFFFFSFLGRRRRWASHIIDRSKLGLFPVTMSDFFSFAYGCLSIYSQFWPFDDEIDSVHVGGRIATGGKLRPLGISAELYAAQ